MFLATKVSELPPVSRMTGVHTYLYVGNGLAGAIERQFFPKYLS